MDACLPQCLMKIRPLVMILGWVRRETQVITCNLKKKLLPLEHDTNDKTLKYFWEWRMFDYFENKNVSFNGN